MLQDLRRGDGLKTREVFELLGQLDKRPTSVADQKRIIGYVQLTDVDGSGTIDFFEFLQLMRLVMEHDTKCVRAREMELISTTKFHPDEVDALREAFDQFDTSGHINLTLAQLKRLFDKAPGKDHGLLLDREKMLIVTELFKQVDNASAKCRTPNLKKHCAETQCVDFGEFCVLVNLLSHHPKFDMSYFWRGVMRRCGITKWMQYRQPSADEVRGRWELTMLERHTQNFIVQMMHEEHKRSDEHPRPLLFDPHRVPSSKKTSSNRFTRATWELLEADEETSVRRESKSGRISEGIPPEPAKKPGHHVQHESKDSKKRSPKGSPSQGNTGRKMNRAGTGV